jgi:hypothetical protein
MPTRSLPPLARRWLAVLLVAALAVRALVPAGWMPGTTPAGAATLVLCTGTGPMTVAMPGMHHGKADDPAKPAPEHPCAFAGLALAWAPAELPPAIVPPAFAAFVAPREQGGIAIGRGLAAPPPPPTGPPLLA